MHQSSVPTGSKVESPLGGTWHRRADRWEIVAADGTREEFLDEDTNFMVRTAVDGVESLFAPEGDPNREKFEAFGYRGVLA